MWRTIFSASLCTWFLAASLIAFADGEEASQTETFVPDGTGVGVGNPTPRIRVRADETLLRPVRSTLRSEPLSTDYIEAALDAPLKSPLEFENQPLSEVIDYLKSEYSLPIFFDTGALDEVAISPESPVTISVKNVSLRAALNLILLEPGLEDLSFAVVDELLKVTTKERCAESMFVRVYPTEDFVYNNGPSPYPGGNWAEYSPLINVIQDCVAYDTWQENGSGEGQIQIIKPGILIVYQQYRVHVEIEKLLNDLRKELQVMEKELGREALKETGRYYGRSKPDPPSGGGRGGRGYSAGK
jgi:hypothetical protein